MHARVETVKALPNFMLALTFKTGESRVYDVKPLIAKYSAFQPLKYCKGLFEQVRTDCGGCAVAWNDNIDIDAEELLQG